MSVMTVLDVGLNFMEKWIPAGPARAIPPVVGSIPTLMHLWNKTDAMGNPKLPEQIDADRGKILPEVGMTAVEAGLSVVAGPLGSFIGQYVREWWASSTTGPMTGEITRMAQGIEAVSENKPADPSTSTPVMKYK